MRPLLVLTLSILCIPSCAKQEPDTPIADAQQEVAAKLDPVANVSQSEASKYSAMDMLDTLRLQYRVLMHLDSTVHPPQVCENWGRLYSWNVIRIVVKNKPELADSLATTIDSIESHLVRNIEGYVPHMRDELLSSVEDTADYKVYSMCNPSVRFLNHIQNVRSLAQELGMDPDKVGLAQGDMRQLTLEAMNLEIIRDQKMGGKHWLGCECDEVMENLFHSYQFRQSDFTMTLDEWFEFTRGPEYMDRRARPDQKHA